MATSLQSWPWLFEPQPTDSAEVKEVHDELLKDEEDLTDIDFSTDDYSVNLSGCISYIADHVVTESSSKDDQVKVIFKEQSVQFPAFVSTMHSIAPVVKANDIRYVAIIDRNLEEVHCEDAIVLLSIWIPVNRAIVNIFLRVLSVKEGLLLGNSISKLIFEVSGKSAMRMKKFHLVQSGAVLVSSCSVDERDEREKLIIENAKNMTSGGAAKDEASGTLEGDSVGKKENQEGASGNSAVELEQLKQQKMYFMLDEESLSLYEHPLSPKPIYDFRFYKESQPNAIDMIYICNSTGQLEIQQQQQVFFISPTTRETDENFNQLSSLLKDGAMKPKPMDIFSDLRKFAEFFGEPPTQKPNPSTKAPETSKPVSSQNPSSMPASLRLPFPPSQSPIKNEAEQWLKSLQTGDHLANRDEDLQLTWFGIEHELTKYLEVNIVPESDIESAGLNPDSIDQLRTAVEDIKDILLNNDFSIALSRVRGLMKVFGGTILKSVNTLDEVELLKRIYFLTG